MELRAAVSMEAHNSIHPYRSIIYLTLYRRHLLGTLIPPRAADLIPIGTLFAFSLVVQENNQPSAGTSGGRERVLACLYGSSWKSMEVDIGACGGRQRKIPRFAEVHGSLSTLVEVREVGEHSRKHWTVRKLLSVGGSLSGYMELLEASTENLS